MPREPGDLSAKAFLETCDYRDDYVGREPCSDPLYDSAYDHCTNRRDSDGAAAASSAPGIASRLAFAA